MKVKNFILLFLLVLICISCYKEIDLTPDVKIPENNYFSFSNHHLAFDINRKEILCPINNNTINFSPLIVYHSINSLSINGIQVNDNTNFTFDSISTKLEYELSIETVSGEMIDFVLKFTFLPILQIFTSSSPAYEDKILGKILITEPELNNIPVEHKIGIRKRGNIYKNYPKISYNFEFWGDNYGNIREDYQFSGLRLDDDWILDAMYKDKCRMRNRVSFDIWKEISRLYHQQVEPEAKDYIEGKMIELFFNNSYEGIYALNEKLDRKQLQLDILEGLLYESEEWSSSSKFEALSDTSNSLAWDGWKIQYSGIEEKPLWGPLYDYIWFVINSSDTDYLNQIQTYTYMNNAVDYYIFLNLTKAYDNYGKNIFIARYKENTPFFFCPWDLDATWGRNWDVSSVSSDGILYNYFFERLINLNPGNYNKLLSNRWNELRQDIITHSNMISVFNIYFNQLESSGALNREMERWPESELNLSQEIDSISNWLNDRLVYLDHYFDTIDN